MRASRDGVSHISLDQKNLLHHTFNKSEEAKKFYADVKASLDAVVEEIEK